MPQDVRMWEIQDGDRLREIKHAKLNLEERIENWLEQDISIISDDLLVIGRQIGTALPIFQPSNLPRRQHHEMPFLRTYQ